MKHVTLLLAVTLATITAHSQPIVAIGAGASTSGGQGNIILGYRCDDNVTLTGSFLKSDKIKTMLTAQVGYNAFLSESLRLNVSGGAGFISHNTVRKERAKRSVNEPFTKGVAVLTTSLDWHFHEDGALYIEAQHARAFNGFPVWAGSVGVRFYINK